MKKDLKVVYGENEVKRLERKSMKFAESIISNINVKIKDMSPDSYTIDILAKKYYSNPVNNTITNSESYLETQIRKYSGVKLNTKKVLIDNVSFDMHELSGVYFSSYENADKSIAIFDDKTGLLLYVLPHLNIKLLEKDNEVVVVDYSVSDVSIESAIPFYKNEKTYEILERSIYSLPYSRLCLFFNISNNYYNKYQIMDFDLIKEYINKNIFKYMLEFEDLFNKDHELYKLDLREDNPYLPEILNQSNHLTLNAYNIVMVENFYYLVKYFTKYYNLSDFPLTNFVSIKGLKISKGLVSKYIEFIDKLYTMQEDIDVVKYKVESFIFLSQIYDNYEDIPTDPDMYSEITEVGFKEFLEVYRKNNISLDGDEFLRFLDVLNNRRERLSVYFNLLTKSILTNGYIDESILYTNSVEDDNLRLEEYLVYKAKKDYDFYYEDVLNIKYKDFKLKRIVDKDTINKYLDMFYIKDDMLFSSKIIDANYMFFLIYKGEGKIPVGMGYSKNNYSINQLYTTLYDNNKMRSDMNKLIVNKQYA